MTSDGLASLACQSLRQCLCTAGNETEAVGSDLPKSRLRTLEASEAAVRWQAWLPGLWAILLVASLPPAVVVGWLLAGHLKRSLSKPATPPPLRGTEADTDELSGVRQRLTVAVQVDAAVAARVSYGTVALGWWMFIVAWGPQPWVMVTGLDLAGVFGDAVWVEGLFTALGPTLIGLSVRPTDRVGVRLTGGLFAFSYLLLAATDLLPVSRARAAFDHGETMPPYVQVEPPPRSEWVLVLAALSLAQAASELAAAAAFATSFCLEPRAALGRIWTALRGVCFALSVVLPLQLIAALQVDPSFTTRLTFPLRVSAAAASFACALGLSPLVRRRLHACLGSFCLKDEVRSLAAVGALMGGRRPDDACAAACRSFRLLPWRALTAEDCASSADSGLHERTEPAKVGCVDAFVSHSWSDDGQEKYEALASWARAFEHEVCRPPTLWLDKACINQSNVDESLAGLPVYLAGCRKLVVLAGPSYSSRLWCAMEIFVWLQMGRGKSDVTVVPFGDHGHARGSTKEKRLGARRRDQFSRFELAHARCAVRCDTHRLLAVIEAAFGSHAPFNTLMRSILSERVFVGACGELLSRRPASLVVVGAEV